MKNGPLRVLLIIDVMLVAIAIYLAHIGRSESHRNDFFGLWVVVPFFFMFIVGLLAYVIMLGSTLRYPTHISALHKLGLVIMLGLFSLPVAVVGTGATESTTLIALYALTLAVEICLIPVRKLFAYLLFLSRLTILGLAIVHVVAPLRYDSIPFWMVMCAAVLICTDLYGMFKSRLARYLLPG